MEFPRNVKQNILHKKAVPLNIHVIAQCYKKRPFSIQKYAAMQKKTRIMIKVSQKNIQNG